MVPRGIRRETSAGGVVVRRDPAPRYLLILDGHGNWGFPKGHLKRGESPEDAARREIAEETGLDILLHAAPIATVDWHFRDRGRTVHKVCHLFLFESPGGAVRPQQDEGITACRWCDAAEARALLTFANARDVLAGAELLVSELPA